MYYSKRSDDYSRFLFLRVYIVVAFANPPVRIVTMWTAIHSDEREDHENYKFIPIGLIGNQ